MDHWSRLHLARVKHEMGLHCACRQFRCNVHVYSIRRSSTRCCWPPEFRRAFPRQPRDSIVIRMKTRAYICRLRFRLLVSFIHRVPMPCDTRTHMHTHTFHRTDGVEAVLLIAINIVSFGGNSIASLKWISVIHSAHGIYMYAETCTLADGVMVSEDGRVAVHTCSHTKCAINQVQCIRR